MRNFITDLQRRLAGAQTKETVGPQDHDARTAFQSFLQSGLFVQEWYLASNPDLVAANKDPLSHFFELGWREGRRPNPYFDCLWYLSKNPDVAASGMNPLIHYWRYGERENRQPIAFFDTEWYRETYKDEIGTGSALSHYLRNRMSRQFSPNRFFDVQYYLKANSDVADAGIDPFEHFITTGYREGRNPSESFDTNYYSRRYLRNDPRDPITHFFEIGRTAGYATHRDRTRATHASELRRFTSKGPEFEELSNQIAGSRHRAKVVAFYLPQFHSFPENDRWWGKGFTEWTNVSRGTPRFEGHYQPRVPRDFGFYDLNDPRVLPQQVAAARAAGLFGFCFYYYNFNGVRLLHKPVEDYLTRHDINFPFCIMWANENWTRRWDGLESEVLMEQKYRREDAEALVADIARHFKDKRYIRVGGRPIFFVYRPDVIPSVSDMLSRWRELFKSLHGETPLIFMVQGFDNFDPTVFGFDGAIEFPPHKVAKDLPLVNSDTNYFDENFAGRIHRYEDVVRVSVDETPPSFPLIKTVFPSWDNDARRQGQGTVFTGSTPAKYAEWLDKSIEFARKNPVAGESFVFVNAWNEWAEGTYLEPDLHFGGAYLNATARAIAGIGLAAKHKILLVGHDAHNHGAQLLLLNLATVLKRRFGFEVHTLLRGDGDLIPDYRGVAALSVVSSANDLPRAIKDLADKGFSVALTNTVVVGDTVPILSDAGMRVVSLVHELPRIISERHLGEQASLLAEYADEVVFPAGSVRDAFTSEIGVVGKLSSVRPQGLYQKIEFDDAARGSVRSEFGLPANSKIVVNVGYGDLRKGVDLFCHIARLTAAAAPDTVFMWIGKIDAAVSAWLEKEETSNLKFVGQRTDVARLLSAADVFALTSREDPFPSVVLEALSAGLPVVAFQDAGGFVDFLRTEQLGELVPYADISRMASAIVNAGKRDRATIQQHAVNARSVIAEQFSFPNYAFDLAQKLDPSLKRISVIVPNYNYERYIADRLASIFNQSYPVYEVIVLDDCSSDDSVRVIEETALATQREIKLVRNERNSGSVFKQWAKGVATATGDLVWIAEADDLSDPRFLAQLVQFFDRDSALFAFSDSVAIDSDGRQLTDGYKSYYSTLFAGALERDLREPGAEFAANYLSQRNMILNVSSVLWSRNSLQNALDKVKSDLSEFTLAGDWLVYLAACAHDGDVGYLASPLNTHRRHVGGVTSKTKGERQIQEIERIHQYANKLFGSSAVKSKSQQSYIAELRHQFDISDSAADDTAA